MICREILLQTIGNLTGAYVSSITLVVLNPEALMCKAICLDDKKKMRIGLDERVDLPVERTADCLF